VAFTNLIPTVLILFNAIQQVIFQNPHNHQCLKDRQQVRLRQVQLENRNPNITTQLSHIIKAFPDFRLLAQIKEEIEKVKPSSAFTT